MPTLPRSVAALAVAAGLVFAGCGDDDDPVDTEAPTGEDDMTEEEDMTDDDMSEEDMSEDDDMTDDG